MVKNGGENEKEAGSKPEFGYGIIVGTCIKLVISLVGEIGSIGCSMMHVRVSIR